MNGFNLSDITDAKLGATTLGSIYLGSIKLWESDPQINEYLWFKVTNGGYLYFEINDNNTPPQIPFEIAIEYSKDKTNWTSVSLSTAGTKSTNVTVYSNETLYVRGNNSSYTNGSTSIYFHFRSPANTDVGGNIMSLVYGSNFKGKTTLSSAYVFNSLFANSTYLKNAQDLRLPVTSIPRYGFQNMFSGCTNLETAPKIIYTTYIDYYGCANMFYNCKKLTTVPDFSTVTRVNGYAFSSMFSGCIALTVLPDFHNVATIEYWAPWRNTFSGCTSIEDARWNVNGTRLLPDHLTVTSGGSAYELMFSGCTGLKYAPELTETSPHTGEYNTMFQNCTSLYTLITHATSLGSNYFNNIVKGTGRRGTVRKASDVTWDSTQYTQFTYSGSGSSALMWQVSAGDYTSGDYQT